MKLAPLFDMTVRYTEIRWAEPLDRPGGTEGQGWALREGRVDGARVRGTYKACNHPHRRADNVNEPEVYGMIATDDGALVYYEIHAYGLLEPGKDTRRVVGSMTFKSGAPQYVWLNSCYATVEGSYVRGPDGLLQGTFHAYECVSDF